MGKALWAIFVTVLPFLGVFVDLIARGHSMADRDVEQALEDRGVINDAEFQQQKTKLLA